MEGVLLEAERELEVCVRVQAAGEDADGATRFRLVAEVAPGVGVAQQLFAAREVLEFRRLVDDAGPVMEGGAGDGAPVRGCRRLSVRHARSRPRPRSGR